MTRPGIEPLSLGPLPNTVSIYIYIYIYKPDMQDTAGEAGTNS